MTVATVQGWLLWCTALNFGILALWAGLLILPHAWLYRIWRRWAPLTDVQFDMLMFYGLTFYKSLVLVFNLVPYVALRIVAG